MSKHAFEIEVTDRYIAEAAFQLLANAGINVGNWANFIDEHFTQSRGKNVYYDIRDSIVISWNHGSRCNQGRQEEFYQLPYQWQVFAGKFGQKPIKVGDHEVSIVDKNNIKVGCVSVNREKIGEILKAMDKYVTK